MKSLSIIIPAYNSEEYLSQCLDSVLKLDDPGIEIVLINDGSTDRTADICRHYAASFPNIVYVEQENRGVALTRITGIKQSTGEYITFLDSDDWIGKNAYSRVLSVARERNSDIVIYGHIRCHGDGRREVYSHYREITDFNGREAVGENLKTKITTVLWDKVFKRDLFLNPDNIIPKVPCFEDQMAIMRLLLLSKKVTIVPDCLVFYRLREGSLTSDSFAKYSEVLFQQLDDVKWLLKESDIYPDYRAEFQLKYLNLVFTFIINKMMKSSNGIMKISSFPMIKNKFSKISKYYMFNDCLSLRMKAKIFFIKNIPVIYQELFKRGYI